MIGKKAIAVAKGLEFLHDEPIEDLLLHNTRTSVCKRLGISKMQYWYWVKNLGLQYSASNLPDCDKCKCKTKECQTSKICRILLDAWYPAYVIVEKFKQMGGDVKGLEEP